MSQDFANFVVPHFNGFSDDSSNEEVEYYFEIDHENSLCFQGQDNTSSSHSSESAKELKTNFRRSLSTGNLRTLQEEKRKKELIPHKNQLVIDHCDANIEVRRKRKCKEKYVSVGEMVAAFWSSDKYNVKLQTKKISSTIPKTPNLTTKNRLRTTAVLSKEEREELEMKIARENQVKARPLNKKILAGPEILGAVAKREVTVPKPFKLTEPSIKKIEEHREATVAQFHARGVPKSVYHPPQELRVPLTHVAKQISNKKVPEKPLTKIKPSKPTTIEPFSFDCYVQQMNKKKEEQKNKVIEEEKKAREFRARPIPKAILNKEGSSSGSSVKSVKTSDNLDSTPSRQFKATSPRVLRQKPFVPKKLETSLIEHIPKVQLHSEIRAKQRQEYDKLLQEKQEERNRMKAMSEEQAKKKEEEEIRRLREKCDFKANTVRQFKKLDIQPSNKVTIPESPNFISKKMKENKENIDG